MKGKIPHNIFSFVVLTCVVGCFIFFYLERNRYNLVSEEELDKIEGKLQSLTLEEKEDLAFFFKYANQFEGYPYVLVGYKSMSLCNFIQESEDLPPIFQKNYAIAKSRNFFDRLEKGLRVWEKYLSVFPQKKYVVQQYHQSCSRGLREVSLIHRNLCMQEIQKHLEIFCTTLQKSLSTEEILEIVMDPEHELFYMIRENQFLLGILLGYGKNNAFLFAGHQHEKLEAFTSEWSVWPRKWRLPGFACDRSTVETKDLKKKYQTARKYIRWTYFNRDSLVVTLALLEKD